jgi:nitroalkane oxidase
MAIDFGLSEAQAKLQTEARAFAKQVLSDGVAMTGKVFAWTAALIWATCTGVMRAAFDCAFEFAKTDCRSGPVPVIEYQNAGYMLADLKMRIEASRYLAWKACHYLDTTGGA